MDGHCENSIRINWQEMSHKILYLMEYTLSKEQFDVDLHYLLWSLYLDITVLVYSLLSLPRVRLSSALQWKSRDKVGLKILKK